MKKTLLLLLLTIFIISCKEDIKSNITPNKTEIKFKDLDVIKSKPEIEMVEFLKRNNYSLLETEYNNQWKSKTSEDIIQFNGNGVFVFFTYNIKTYNKLVFDLDKSPYKNLGKTIKKGLEVEMYVKDNETIFLSTIKHPQNGKQVYSITFLS